jgi:hypothetical protein
VGTIFASLVSALAEDALQLHLPVEIILQGLLPARGDEQDLRYARGQKLVDDELD